MPKGNVSSYTFFSLVREGTGQLMLLWKELAKPYAEAVLLNTFSISRETFLLCLNEAVSTEKTTEFFEKIHRLNQNEPLAYVLESAYFSGVEYDIKPGVLIPRPETEKVVTLVYDLLMQQGWQDSRVFELGFGSGIISLELAKRQPQRMFVGWDISKTAVEVAMGNAKKFGIKTVSFFHGDFFGEEALWRQRHDGPVIAVSNPPYIPSAVIETLEDSVKCFEPRIALDGGSDGLDIYRKFKDNIQYFDAMIFEIGYDLKEPLMVLFSEYSKFILFEKDFAGLDRYFIYRRSV